MEGPSLFLASEQLHPFVGEKIRKVSGNTKIGKERLLGKKILSIFSFGKYLFFQFDTFAFKVHFLLFGSFEATVQGIQVTGDYKKKVREPRLALKFKNGHIEMYNCSIRLVESPNAKEDCDYSTDIMSDDWDEKVVLTKLKNHPYSEIADILLDQAIFTGVGNIIKNEVLLLAKTSPLHLVGEFTSAKLKKIIRIARSYVFQFYEWRKNFVLRKHYRIYKQHVCKQCGTKVVKMITGVRKRKSYICPHCEK